MTLEDLVPLRYESRLNEARLEFCRERLYEARKFPDVGALVRQAHELNSQAHALARQLEAFAVDLSSIGSRPDAVKATFISEEPVAAIATAVRRIADIVDAEQEEEGTNYVGYLLGVGSKVECVLAELGSPNSVKILQADRSANQVKHARKLELQLHREAVAWLDQAWEDNDTAGDMQGSVQRIYPLSGDSVDPVLHTVIGEDQPGGEHSLARGSVLVCDEAGYQVLMPDHPQGNFVLRKATVIVVA